jgi:RNA polymerase sigma factor (sigma-70 family)
LTTENILKVETVITKEKGKLFNYIRRLVPTKEEAEDILQDVFIKLILNFESFHLLDRVSSWMIHVAKNRIIDSKRKMKPELFLDFRAFTEDKSTSELITLEDVIPDLSNLPDEIYWQNQFWDEIEVALDDMPPKQREIFKLTEFEGMTFKEIAKMKDEPISTILSRKKFAVQFLRKRLYHLYKELENDV